MGETKSHSNWFLTRVLRHSIGLRPWVVIGNFDGCHLGHQKLFQTAIDQSQGHALGITFYPHPREALHKQPVLYIDTLASRIQKMLNAGLSQVWVIHFTPAFSKIKWEAFCEGLFLKEDINPQGVCVGEDFRMGHDRNGTADHLKKWLNENQMECKILSDVTLDGKRVSSEWVRQAVIQGDFETAHRTLKSHYEITGTVKQGPQMGRKLGFPTANVYPALSQLLPPYGVYIAYTFIEGRNHPSILNVGVRPTLKSNQKEVVVESHVLDFNEKLYGKLIKVQFLKYLRPEKKFDSMDDLKQQITKDVACARGYFKKQF
jgi:riboflavin kinase / FMN adenylyltransferase